jgi:hypothetical protein
MTEEPSQVRPMASQVASSGVVGDAVALAADIVATVGPAAVAALAELKQSWGFAHFSEAPPSSRDQNI